MLKLIGYWKNMESERFKTPKTDFCNQIKKAKMSINLDSRFVDPKITSSFQFVLYSAMIPLNTNQRIKMWEAWEC